MKKVDVDANAEASQAAGINCMPTFKVYKNGEEVFKQSLPGTTLVTEFCWEDECSWENDGYYIRVSQMDGEMAWINPIPFAP